MPINIAFCFDENFWMYAGVTIASLLEADAKSKYYVHCVCPDGFWRGILIKNLSRYKNAVLQFHAPTRDYDHSFIRKYWTPAIYYRLMLPELLPELDSIIYADCDVVFNQGLGDLQKFINKRGKKDEFIWAVKDNMNLPSHSKLLLPYHKLLIPDYINSGFLVMNLKEIREAKLALLWKVMSKNQYVMPDQDILSITCAGKIGFLPLKYNCYFFDSPDEYKLKGKRITMREVLKEMEQEKLFTAQEIQESLKTPVVIHSYGQKMAWSTRTQNPLFDYLFWKAARKMDYFELLNQEFVLQSMGRGIENAMLERDLQNPLKRLFIRWRR